MPARVVRFKEDAREVAPAGSRKRRNSSRILNATLKGIGDAFPAAESSVNYLSSAVGVAQLVERRSVAPNVAGSNPVSHPNFPCFPQLQ
jgi:hypothetical protein